MIGKWFLPLPFIFANKNYTLTLGTLRFLRGKELRRKRKIGILNLLLYRERE